MKLAISAGLMSLIFYVKAQDTFPNRAFSVINENDVYLLVGNDRYYSNGIFMNYRWTPNLFSEKPDQTKRIIEIGLGQQFWTPQDLVLIDVNEFDRPYAGLLYTHVAVSSFSKPETRLQYGLEVGTTGQASGNQAFQEFYHKTFGFPKPRGWGYQIPNAFIVNVKADYMRQFRFSAFSDLISTTQARVGTGFAHAIQRLDFRVGQLRPLSSSAFANAFLGKDAQLSTKNSFMFLGYGLEYVLYNITLEGPLRKNAIHTEEALPWVHHFRLGYVTNTNRTTLKVTFNWLSPEVADIDNHAYIGLEFFYRWAVNR